MRDFRVTRKKYELARDLLIDLGLIDKKKGRIVMISPEHRF